MLTPENRAVVTRKTLIALAFRHVPKGPKRALPYSLPLLAITKLHEGGMQNIVDVSYLLGSADSDEVEDVRRLAADEGSQFVDDIEDLLVIGRFEADMHRERYLPVD